MRTGPFQRVECDECEHEIVVLQSEIGPGYARFNTLPAYLNARGWIAKADEDICPLCVAKRVKLNGRRSVET